MYDIQIANRQSLLEIDEDALRAIAVRSLRAEQVAAAEISIALVDDPAIHELNKKHLNHNYPTDVLSFLFECDLWEGECDLWEGEAPAEPGVLNPTATAARREPRPPTAPAVTDISPVPRGHHKRIDGEIVVSTETAIAQSGECGTTPWQELVLYVVHGLLHLAGYDDLDEDESRVMRTRERDILELCELSPTLASSTAKGRS